MVTSTTRSLLSFPIPSNKRSPFRPSDSLRHASNKSRVSDAFHCVLAKLEQVVLDSVVSPLEKGFHFVARENKWIPLLQMQMLVVVVRWGQTAASV
jgi:hypothetical protein